MSSVLCISPIFKYDSFGVCCLFPWIQGGNSLPPRILHFCKSIQTATYQSGKVECKRRGYWQQMVEPVLIWLCSLISPTPGNSLNLQNEILNVLFQIQTIVTTAVLQGKKNTQCPLALIIAPNLLPFTCSIHHLFLGSCGRI